jgi:hypothetical protein
MERICLLLTVLFPMLVMAQTDTTSVREKELQEVVISANNAQQRLKSVQICAEQIQVKSLAAAPALFGEVDIMRSLQLLPGVKSESDASSSFQVRGGTAAQNTILYDKAPIYNIGHMAGLFSAFNDNALASATLYKGLVPAQYGGASSAVLDIVGRTGRNDRWGGNVSIGLLSAKGLPFFYLNYPFLKNNLSSQLAKVYNP